VVPDDGLACETGAPPGAPHPPSEVGVLAEGPAPEALAPEAPAPEAPTPEAAAETLVEPVDLLQRRPPVGDVAALVEAALERDVDAAVIGPSRSTGDGATLHQSDVGIGER